MSETKCPFCQQELERVLQLAGAGGLIEEAYLLCSKCNIRGERKLWQALIDTKKKLDLAITELKNVVEDDDFDIYMRQLSAQTTLEQINKKEENNGK